VNVTFIRAIHAISKDLGLDVVADHNVLDYPRRVNLVVEKQPPEVALRMLIRSVSTERLKFAYKIVGDRLVVGRTGVF
jgi:hypothetical protein